APDFDLYWGAGNSGLPLVISANSQTDTTLVVRTPSGQWLCEDDGGFNGMNPGMRIDNPQAGLYDIWVGTYGGGTAQATLRISELTSHYAGAPIRTPKGRRRLRPLFCPAPRGGSCPSGAALLPPRPYQAGPSGP